MKNKSLVIGIIVVAVGAGGFFGGMQYQKLKAPSFAERGSGNVRGQFTQGGDHQPGQDDGFRGRFSGQGRPVFGEVIAKDSESITVKIEDGGSKIVFISDTTIVAKTDEGSLDDLTEGVQVLVFGSENEDGSVTAENIQLNPEFGTDRFSQDHQEEN